MENIQYISDLAMIELKDLEKDRLIKDVELILEYTNKLDELNEELTIFNSVEPICNSE